MKWLCRLLHHKWVFDRNERAFTDSAGAEHWFYEFSTCARCGAQLRELVASPRG